MIIYLIHSAPRAKYEITQAKRARARMETADSSLKPHQHAVIYFNHFSNYLRIFFELFLLKLYMYMYSICTNELTLLVVAVAMQAERQCCAMHDVDRRPCQPTLRNPYRALDRLTGPNDEIPANEPLPDASSIPRYSAKIKTIKKWLKVAQEKSSKSKQKVVSYQIIYNIISNTQTFIFTKIVTARK